MPNNTQDTGKYITRFAPSPTGYLHLGHAYSALMAYQQARANGGDFILRIEDIDQGRCRSEFVSAILDDLKWLGLSWPEPVRIQSHHFGEYDTALQHLKNKGVAYPCFCTRKDIQEEISRAPSAPHGPEGIPYPGTCRNLNQSAAEKRIKAGEAHAWRLDLTTALETIASPVSWCDQTQGNITAKPELLGDIVLARKDTPTSYHLSVVCDDALQGITHVIRGEDLFHATHIHVVLQKLLGLPTPVYQHHKLLTDESGKRYAKRDKAQTLAQIRESGKDAEALIRSLVEEMDE